LRARATFYHGLRCAVTQKIPEHPPVDHADWREWKLGSDQGAVRDLRTQAVQFQLAFKLSGPPGKSSVAAPARPKRERRIPPAAGSADRSAAG